VATEETESKAKKFSDFSEDEQKELNEIISKIESGIEISKDERRKLEAAFQVMETRVVRPLTEEEEQLFSRGAVSATLKIPAFRDSISLMRPFYDSFCETAYTDRYARVGLGPWFFSLSTNERAAVILHETMHVLNNHFERGDEFSISPQIMNIAGDFEINCSLRALPSVRLPVGIYPDVDPFSFPANLSMESYAQLLKDKEKEQQKQSGQSGDSSSSSNSGSQSDSSSKSGGSSGAQSESASSDEDNSSSGGESSDSTSNSSKSKPASGCKAPTEESVAAADEAGISRASASEQSVAKRNTAARVREDLNAARQAGNSHMEKFLSVALDRLTPPKADWRGIFRSVVSRNCDAISRGREDYSYRRVNRRMSSSKYIFPGMIKYTPTTMFAFDTSGSMQNSDYQALMSEVEGIIKSVIRDKNGLRVFAVDTKPSKIKTVNSIRRIDIQGGGGTDMSVAFQYVNELNKREKPDLFILATDGGTDWNSVAYRLREGNRRYSSVILITSKYGVKAVTEEVKSLATVIDISY
jgi:predicted metal-dependent peptidase